MEMTQHAIKESLSVWLRKLIKDLLGRVLLFTRLHRQLFRNRAVVVAFHSITPGPGDGALRCSVDDFDEYCQFFARYMDVCSLSDLKALVDDNRPLDGKCVITFDDGYADNAELAAPILKKHGLSATFYVTTGFVDSKIQTGWDRAAGIQSRWMSRDQVRALHDAGYDIGAHTRTHCDLGLVSESVGLDEIRGSAEDIREWTGRYPRHFAIPYGRSFESIALISDRVRNELGFDTVTLCRGGVMNPDTNVHAWERIPISPNDYLSPYGWYFDVVRDVNRTSS